ncbi:TetR/AcrR family transcriptional regulator [Nonomuraea turcica]|uniref:TetR/AcrR family transcriptional regulator n=1 Tax=Nonomuraea sp. G32 TaxID=3067274 RepID=UPI00273C6393|nr:TetR/AcrR family transcriptional regulator [Nonomuraea sp. G32]MDP4511786.1 TetR/AcrR family transcriptional regulator [Nonomuraea sp. G32]
MPTNRGGRRPDPEVDDAIRKAMAELLFERGFDMTFDDVAAHAGVGRTTVFRRHPTKKDLILEAFSQVSIEQFRPADTGSIRGDLYDTLSQIMRVFADPRMRMLMRQGLGEACRDPAFTDLFRAVLDRRLELITVLVERAVNRGELPASTSPLLIADLISGVIAVRVAVDTPLPDPGELTALVDGLLYGFTHAE